MTAGCDLTVRTNGGQATEGLIADGVWRLPGAAIVRVNGADALSFLHGQLTQAVTTLDDERAHPAAYCTAQGRLLANGVLWRASADSVHWMVSRDLAESLMRRLGLFVLRRQVSMRLLDDHVVLGARGAGSVPPPLHDKAPWTRVTINGDHWIVAPPSTREHPAAWCVAPESAVSLAPATSAEPASGAWDALRLASGWPWIQADSADKFLPAALDLDLNGTIDFRKGCYPGQEIIARSHYRGTVKRRLAYGSAPVVQDPACGVQAPAAGGVLSDLYLAGGEDRPIGRVIECALQGDRLHVAAEVLLPQPAGAAYALGSPAGPALTLRLIHGDHQTAS
ncbi:Folate-binding protein YgfZ OS=Castellaniella defragrans OX=75697 GN=HNR28_003603 PE=4 SV=1 [Castellaniella defragrans]